jgi:hypothetical protein
MHLAAAADAWQHQRQQRQQRWQVWGLQSLQQQGCRAVRDAAVQAGWVSVVWWWQ